MNLTTIVAIVAFVSLLIIFVILISSWRQGNKKRSAAIQAIEQSINDVVYELSEMNSTWKNTCERMEFERNRADETKAAELEKLIEKVNATIEPIEQMQNMQAIEPMEPMKPIKTIEPQGPGEISLDFDDLEGFDNLTLDDIDLLDSIPDMDIQEEYQVGRSGKKYTAQELESLIKE